MELKTYRGRSLAEALAEVRRDLGSDAVVVRTRTVPAAGAMGGLLPSGFSGRSVVEIEARSPAAPEPAKQLAPTQPVSARDDGFVQTVWPVEGSGASKGGAPEPTPTPLPLAGQAAPESTISEEVRSLRDMLAELLAQSRDQSRTKPVSADAPAEPVALADLRRSLLAAGVEAQVIDDVAARALESLRTAAVMDGPTVRKHASAVLATMLPVCNHLLWTMPEATPGTTVIAFVGPTGVGKTTTIAKLAASFKLKLGRRVALITSDTYRIAAVEQLRTYAEIIGLPIRVVMSPQEMQAVRAGLSGFDVVLIDTAGRSPKDAERLEELNAHITAIQPDITLLTLALNADARAIERSAQQFASLKPTGVIYTKLDEAVVGGAILNISAKHGLPTSLLTTGQEVPDDLEMPSSQSLASLVLEGPVRATSPAGGVA